ncbi:MAG: flagellar biosynthesis protein FliQ [Spirochaetales bacterium]|nr:flagellar biosynthesis protein FliQ [Spirochaetales bacterium]
MSEGEAIAMFRGAIIQMLIIAAPILMVGLFVGLIISIFQATTSIQEQTLTFVPKIAAIMIVLILLAPWVFSNMGDYTTILFEKISRYGGG